MSVPTPCPPPERLRGLLADEAPADQADLVAHLDACLACREALERMAAAPAVLETAMTLGRVRYLNEPPLRRVLGLLESDADLTLLLQSAAAQSESKHPTWVRSMLRPGGSPEALGTL